MVVDSRTGVFGHRISMLDFTPGELERFRALGRLVGTAMAGGPIRRAAQRYLGSRRLTHNALEDALAQAEMLRGLMEEMGERV